MRYVFECGREKGISEEIQSYRIVRCVWYCSIVYKGSTIPLKQERSSFCESSILETRIVPNNEQHVFPSEFDRKYQSVIYELEHACSKAFH